jgi:iron complex transport system substrate-binding protein
MIGDEMKDERGGRARAWPWRAVLLAMALLAAGCGGAERRATQPATNAGGGFPVTLTDAQGVEVRVEGRPERIVSAAPTVTEILFALGAGDRVVAATDQCGYPAEAGGLPRIGGWFTPSAEKTLGARPDLIIGSRGNPADFVAAMRKSGCPLFTIDPKTLDDIFDAIEQIALIIGEREAGEELVGRMRERLGAVAARVAGASEEERPTAFIMLQVSPLWTAGKGTFQDDAIRAAGARNVASEKDGFAPYSTETLMAADPDFLLLSTMEGAPDRMKREVEADPALRRLSAVRGDGVVVLEADPIMRPGPRIVEAVEAMAEAFYGTGSEAAGRPAAR